MHFKWDYVHDPDFDKSWIIKCVGTDLHNIQVNTPEEAMYICSRFNELETTRAERNHFWKLCRELKTGNCYER